MDEMDETVGKKRAPKRRGKLGLALWVLFGLGLAAAYVPSYKNAFVAEVGHESYATGSMPGAAQERSSFNFGFNIAMGRLGFTAGRGTFNATFSEPKGGWNFDFGRKENPGNFAQRGVLGFSGGISKNTGADATANPAMSMHFGVPLWFALLVVALAVYSRLRGGRKKQQQGDPSGDVTATTTTPEPQQRAAA
jgi:hypothetical protein